LDKRPTFPIKGFKKSLIKEVIFEGSNGIIQVNNAGRKLK